MTILILAQLLCGDALAEEGTSYKKILKEYRLGLARSLLIDTQLSIDDIALFDRLQ